MRAKISLLILGIILISISFAGIAIAHSEEEFAEAENLIQQKISCSQLTQEQLELIGDYYMEQMHPGELHEIMDERMGGEGSETLKQVHINIARTFYCGERTAMSSNMMSIMMGRSGMMGSYAQYTQNSYAQYNVLTIIIALLIAIILIIIIVLIAKQLIKANNKNGKRKKS